MVFKKAHKKYLQLRPFVRGVIVGMKICGKSLREIAATVGCSVETVKRTYDDWQKDGKEFRKPGSGRKKTTSDREDRRLIRLALNNRKVPSNILAQQWNESLKSKKSSSTVRKRLCAKSIFARRPTLVLPLTGIHRRNRFDWCKVRRDWKEEWSKIVFTDESRFALFKNDGRINVRRRRNERQSNDCFLERHTVPTMGVMVWGAISYNSKSPLVRIEGTINAKKYISDVLEPVCIPFLRKHRGAVFQQDNARPHTAHIVSTYLNDRNIEMSDWPARSPDLSPIENIWGIMKKKIASSTRPPQNIEDLWSQIETAWNEVSQTTIQNLYDSMPRRMRKVLKRRGGAINC